MNKINIFPVQIEICEDGGYFASCMFLQGCHAEGKTYSEVIENIQDVIKTHLELRKEQKQISSSITIERKTPFSVNIPLPVV